MLRARYGLRISGVPLVNIASSRIADMSPREINGKGLVESFDDGSIEKVSYLARIKRDLFRFTVRYDCVQVLLDDYDGRGVIRQCAGLITNPRVHVESVEAIPLVSVQLKALRSIE